MRGKRFGKLSEAITILAGLTCAVISTDAGAEAKAAIVTRAYLPNGQPADVVQFTLWKKSEAAAVSATNRDDWEDKATGEIWTPCGHTQTRFEATYEDVAPGEYRASCGTVEGNGRSDPTPYGLSDTLHVDGLTNELHVDVHLRGDTPLTLEVIDAETRRPIQDTQLRLLREDGLPVGYGSGGFWQRTNEEGIARYSLLATGTYSLRARKNAWRADEAEYDDLDDFLLKVEGNQTNVVTVPMCPKALPQDEIDNRWPFIVTGRATDADGNPMAVVKITASCGMGTLFPTGDAVTGADGYYTLRFTGGMRMKSDDGKWHTGLQAATISARKSGYFERNLHRQGNLAIADERPPTEQIQWVEDVVLPLQPYELNFVMVPAADVRGRVVDENGEPITGVRVTLSGDDLPPSCSVLAQVDVDEGGRFRIGDVPCREFWFSVSGERWNERKTETVRFDRAGSYDVHLTYRQAGLGCVVQTTKGAEQ